MPLILLVMEFANQNGPVQLETVGDVTEQELRIIAGRAREVTYQGRPYPLYLEIIPDVDADTTRSYYGIRKGEVYNNSNVDLIGKTLTSAIFQ